MVMKVVVVQKIMKAIYVPSVDSRCITCSVCSLLNTPLVIRSKKKRNKK